MWALIDSELVQEATRRLLFSISTGALWLLIVFLAIKLGRISNPQARLMLMILPMVKSFFALIRNAPTVSAFNGLFVASVQFPDLAGLMPSRWAPDYEFHALAATQSISGLAARLILISIIAFLAWRSISFARLYNLLAGAPEARRTDYPGLFMIIDKLVEQAQTAYPRIVLIDSRNTPFTVGLTKPTIAVSRKILTSLDRPELEAAFAHEISHIARRDYVFHWPLMLLRDTLFFMPFVPFLFGRVEFERERACDRRSLQYCRPQALALTLVKIAEIHAEEGSLNSVGAVVPQCLLRPGEKELTRRITDLMGTTSQKRPNKLAWTGFYLLIAIMSYAEIHLMIMAGKSVIVLS